MKPGNVISSFFFGGGRLFRDKIIHINYRNVRQYKKAKPKANLPIFQSNLVHRKNLILPTDFTFLQIHTNLKKNLSGPLCPHTCRLTCSWGTSAKPTLRPAAQSKRFISRRREPLLTADCTPWAAVTYTSHRCEHLGYITPRGQEGQTRSSLASFPT